MVIVDAGIYHILHPFVVIFAELFANLFVLNRDVYFFQFLVLVQKITEALMVGLFLMLLLNQNLRKVHISFSKMHKEADYFGRNPESPIFVCYINVFLMEPSNNPYPKRTSFLSNFSQIRHLQYVHSPNYYTLFKTFVAIASASDEFAVLLSKGIRVCLLC